MLKVFYSHIWVIFTPFHPSNYHPEHAGQSSHQAIVICAAENWLSVISVFRFVGLQTGLDIPFQFFAHLCKTTSI